MLAPVIDASRSAVFFGQVKRTCSKICCHENSKLLTDVTVAALGDPAMAADDVRMNSPYTHYKPEASIC